MNSRIRVISKWHLQPLLFFFILEKSFAVSFDEYVYQATKKNSRLDSSQNYLVSSELQKSESKILTSIKAFSFLQLENDHRQPQFPAFEGVSKDKRSFQFGFEQNSSFGIIHKLYTNYSYLDQKGASFIPNPKVANSAMIYEFNVPLLKNFAGRSIKFQQGIINLRNNGNALVQTFEQRKVLAEIRVAYWKLKTAREIVSLQKQMISQGKKFLTWTQRRVNDKLAEESDLRQAEAILELRRFDLQKELMEMKKAEQAFNALRETDISETVGKLDDFPADHLLPILPTEKEALSRPDLLALESQLVAENLETKQAAENSKVELNLIGSASSNGLSYSTNPDYGKTLSGKYPVYSLGLHLSVPLDRRSVRDVQKASILKSRGLASALRRNRYESVASLGQLRLDYEQLLLQLKVVRNLVRAQESKLKTERDRARYGRSSTFQLLTFEQDYQQARQDLIRTQGQLWQLSGQALLYSKQEI